MNIHFAKRIIVLIVITGVILFLLLSAGCARPHVRPFTSNTLKGGQNLKMAILPVDNLSKSSNTGRSLDNILLVEFLKRVPAIVIDPGEVSAAISDARVRLATSIPRETVKSLGKRLEVDFFVIGIVHEYEIQAVTGPGGTVQVPVITFTIRVLDAVTGNIVWATNVTRRGNDRETVFGIGRIGSVSDLAERMAEELADAFAKAVLNAPPAPPKDVKDVKDVKDGKDGKDVKDVKD